MVCKHRVPHVGTRRNLARALMEERCPRGSVLGVINIHIYGFAIYWMGLEHALMNWMKEKQSWMLNHVHMPAHNADYRLAEQAGIAAVVMEALRTS